MGGKVQKGYIYRKGTSWYLRYYDSILEHGKAVRKQIARRVASTTEYKTRKAVLPLVQEILFPINTGCQPVEATMPLSQFVEEVYLPYARVEHRPSTVASYEAIWREHLAARCGSIRIRDFRTVDGEKLLSTIARQTSLTRSSLKHLKSLLSAIFKHAKRQGLLNGVNPMADVSIPKGRESEETFAYSLDEVAKMIAVLPEPASTIVAVAAFSGMRKGEVCGVRWEDVRAGAIYVAQSVWNGHTTEPKTKGSKAAIPLIKPLARLLEKHKQRVGGAQAGLMFCSGTGRPLNLDNLVIRTIRPTIKKAGLEWHGWHGFRRGLATNLHSLGVADKTIQAILRHSSVSVTQNCYIKSIDGAAAEAMATLESKLGMDEAEAAVLM